MKGKNILYVIEWIVLVVCFLFAIVLGVYRIDPYFHFHKPDTDKYYYTLDNERYQNDGIERHFDYDAIVTGTSMTQNFKTSEIDGIFGVDSVKLAFSGATYKEIDDSIEKALAHNPNVTLVIRGLDYGKFFDDANLMRYDEGDYPSYLYDDNPVNDIYYVINRDVLFDRIIPMVINKLTEPTLVGITSFDDYSRWQDEYEFGKDAVLKNGITVEDDPKEIQIDFEDIDNIQKNISMNVTDIAEMYPDIEFYYFWTPYSIAWWNSVHNKGEVARQIAGEKCAIEQILQFDNIHLFSFNDMPELTTDLDNYKDSTHYGEWVNSMILKSMKEEKHMITQENYEAYLEREMNLYSEYDYHSLNE